MNKAAKVSQNPELEAAITLLTADHDLVRDLFRAYKQLMDYDAPAAQREDLAARLCNALLMHAAAEDQLFYPAARAVLAEDAEECLDHAEVEHGSMTRLIDEIRASNADDPLYDSRVHVLCEYVAHHVEEEEGDMFAELRREGADLKGVAKAMTAMRADWYLHVGEPTEGAATPRPRYEQAPAKSPDSTRPLKDQTAETRARVSRAVARKAVTRRGSRKHGADSAASK